MRTLAKMIAQRAQDGQVSWIGLRPARHAAMQAVLDATVTLDGLKGDHGKAGKRAVTLVQAEHLSAVAGFLGRTTPVLPEDLRRNLVVQGINLSALKGRTVRVGTALLSVSGICAPCSRMEDAFGRGGYSAVRGHGGWCAEVVQAGRVSVGDVVVPSD